MSLIPCDHCRGKVVEKLANATWAWWRADGVRVAYRQRLCAQCYLENAAQLEIAVEESPFNCPACHTDPEANMDACYLTVFVPGYGPRRLEMATCAPCAVEIRNRAMVGARLLDDRQGSSEGSEPSPQTMPAAGIWAQLGIKPRDR
jgi:hypothetical protein